eukprot:TRINITY_DN23786_c0_g1_i1.p1 TRINITY_DN23786_c0_g1~~TRINITY_DN23786_c0_g1_i1.p1  ORF type:complete len:614 (+),score=124.73 TRINITY_DN23786_c0_g1_i1:62-1903(+)
MAGGLDSLDGLDDLIGASAGADEDYFPCFEDLTPFEVDYFVQDLEEFKLEEVGGTKWLTHHEHVEKLNWTAHKQAKDGHDEYVVDQFNMLERVPAIIYDLMLIEVWKERIWPLVKAKISNFSSLRTYIPVYHEASLANLLEICLFHRTSCEEAGDALVDVVDWCVRKLRYLLSRPNSELIKQIASAKEAAEWDNLRCIDEQYLECEFQVCMCAISILRFLTDHRAAIPLAITTRLLETHDVLMLLVPLMEKAPWVRKDRVTGRIQKFEDNSWENVPDDDEGRLPKMHTQVWITIYNLVMDADCRNRYELSSFRRENLLRLRRFINEVVVDQLPPLTNLHRTLEEMSISGRFTGAGDPQAASPFVVELVADARETIVRTYQDRWQEVADHQLKEVLVKESPDELKRLGQMISIPKEMFDEPAKGPLPASWPGGSGAAAAGAVAESASWEALLQLPTVLSTASFFAATRDASAPVDAVTVISAVEGQDPDLISEGDKIRFELRRTRYSALCAGMSAPERAKADAMLNSKREPDTYFMSIEAPGMQLSTVRAMSFLSQKGAKKTAKQLADLLEKPGREDLKAMYSDDVAEFSVLVRADATEEGIDVAHAVALVKAA